jgi:23S rRNA (uracil-5-)-methyltransferase RumA
MKKKKKKVFRELADKYRCDGTTPRCAHFGLCGGCMFQDIPYGNQLLLKKEYINNLLEGLAVIDKVSPGEPYDYRNRMDMVTAFGKVGLREPGNYKSVVDIDSCEIMQENSRDLYKKIAPLARNIEGYNYLSHKGFLRYAVIRQARFTGQVMAGLVVAQNDDRRTLDGLIEAVIDDTDSLSIITQGGLADLSFGEITETLKGGFIEEDFDGVRFRITPNSFFQSNSAVALEMYREIKKETEGRVLDLYSGVGTISLFVAGQAEHVTGIEMISESVDNAGINRELNGISNVEFICADTRPFLKEHQGAYDTLIMDPPRSGMHPKVTKAVNEMNTEKIIYMSCNPATFRDDLLILENYRLESFRAWDMFPQTPHVETLAVLKRKQ